MVKGQKVRLRASPRAARDWGVAVGAEGAVLCQYRLAKLNQRECIDVKFDADTIVWGAPAAAFEEVADVPRRR